MNYLYICVFLLIIIYYFCIQKSQKESCMNKYEFNIADWGVSISFPSNNKAIDIHLLPSFSNFSIEKSENELLFAMIVNQQLEEYAEDSCLYSYTNQTNNGDIVVSRHKNGDFQFLVKDIKGEVCSLVHADKFFCECHSRLYGNDSQMSFGLNNAMMMAYAFAGARKRTLLVHASVIRKGGKGYAFVARSGTGKSTQTQNWLKVIPDCDLMNDDNPVVRVIGDEVWVYGSPWSGKTPCYKQVKAPLQAISKIVRSSTNYLEKLDTIGGFSNLVSSCSVLRHDKDIHLGMYDTVSAVCSHVGSYALHCTADPESARVCYEEINK